ncbi:uncharacterized protein LAESUDRAFT_713476 [Laetiporus sulphureus 93-53]|uniref:Uncharacterized protein n=1 Tax=Laetiporus sulphureus 93-53 TaxID=1314785 RepID=A0A165EUV7_9APHY|nr:uncharacterized protein LAESUDRAFT_713476 [Laetiporus sulphureus 93-53]KZT07809.1 hypothetical protein LAESUDRAFT_713476 [Laetiporus sulphureus 93-53]
MGRAVHTIVSRRATPNASPLAPRTLTGDHVYVYSKGSSATQVSPVCVNADTWIEGVVVAISDGSSPGDIFKCYVEYPMDRAICRSWFVREDAKPNIAKHSQRAFPANIRWGPSFGTQDALTQGWHQPSSATGRSVRSEMHVRSVEIKAVSLNRSGSSRHPRKPHRGHHERHLLSLYCSHLI